MPLLTNVTKRVMETFQIYKTIKKENPMDLIITRRFIPIMLVLLFIGACASTHGTIVLVGEIRQATNPGGIKLYTKPPAEYEEIALISADSAHDFMGKEKLLNKAMAQLKEEAAKVGANGILLEGFGDFYIGKSGAVGVPNATGSTTVLGTPAMNTRMGKKAIGMAIFVTEE